MPAAMPAARPTTCPTTRATTIGTMARTLARTTRATAAAALGLMVVWLSGLSGCAATEGPQTTRAGWPMEQLVVAPSPDYDVPPRLLRGNAPVYPISMVMDDKDGRATVAFTVAEDGTTRDIEVLSATHPTFGTHARLAVAKWVFAPATQAGKVVAARLVLELKAAVR